MRPPRPGPTGRRSRRCPAAGLGIVDALSETWGVEGAGTDHQLVWAVVPAGYASGAMATQKQASATYDHSADHGRRRARGRTARALPLRLRASVQGVPRPGRSVRAAPVLRPFEGLAGECDWVALREIVPAATAPLHLRAKGQEATLSTVLPMGYPAMVRLDGSVFLGAQAAGGSGDVSRDLGTALAAALAAGPGTLVSAADLSGDRARLQDLLDVDAPLDVTVRPGFEYWVEGMDEASPDPEVAASLERANSGVVPTARLTSVEAAYWAGLPERATIRWVLPDAEEPLLDALARLHASGGLALGEGTRFIGTFRAHGLLVPVWDLPPDTPAEDAEEPATRVPRAARRGPCRGGCADLGPAACAVGAADPPAHAALIAAGLAARTRGQCGLPVTERDAGLTAC